MWTKRLTRALRSRLAALTRFAAVISCCAGGAAGCSKDIQLPEADQVVAQRVKPRALYCRTWLPLQGNVLKGVRGTGALAKCVAALRPFVKYRCADPAGLCSEIEITPKSSEVARIVDGSLEVRCGDVSNTVIRTTTSGDKATIVYTETAELDEQVEEDLVDCKITVPSLRRRLELKAQRRQGRWE